MLRDHGVPPWSLSFFMASDQGVIQGFRLIVEGDVTQTIITELNTSDEVFDESMCGVGF